MMSVLFRLGVYFACVWSSWIFAGVLDEQTPKPKVVQEKIISEVQRSIRRKLAEEMQLSEEQFQVHIQLSHLRHPEIDGSILGVEVHGLGASGADRLDGLVSLPLTIKTDRQPVEAQLQAVVQVIGPVWVSQKPFKRGDLVKFEDIALVQMPWKKIPSRALAKNQGHFVGKIVKVGISEGQFLHPDLFKEAPLIQAGQKVELFVYSTPGVLIRSQVVAEEEGVAGDHIRVFNPSTKKKMRARVVGDGSVEVRL